MPNQRLQLALQPIGVRLLLRGDCGFRGRDGHEVIAFVRSCAALDADALDAEGDRTGGLSWRAQYEWLICEHGENDDIRGVTAAGGFAFAAYLQER
jgi:hypothetical protein